MAYKDAVSPSDALIGAGSGLAKVFSSIGKFFESLMKSVEKASAANARFQAISKLQEKSDAELAELGIKRDDIVRYVFRDIYYC